MKIWTKKFRNFIFSGLMVLGTLFISLVILELGLAKFFSEKQSGNWGEFHPTRGWALVPGKYLVKPAQKLRGHTININEVGLRGHTISLAPAERRVLMILGDSFTFAKDTRTDRMFTQQLQVLLEKRMPGEFEVLNAGVPGYGTAQQWLLMKELHEKDTIRSLIYVLMFFTNDILDNLCLSYGNLTTQKVRPHFVLAEDGRAVLDRLPESDLGDEEDDTLKETKGGRRIKSISVMRTLAEEWLQPRPGLIRFLGRMGIKARIARMPAILNGWYNENVVSLGLPLTDALIRAMNEEANKHGGRLLVCMIPSPLQVYPQTYIPLLRKSFPDDPLVDGFIGDLMRPQNLVEKMCQFADIPFQDLLPIFLEQNNRVLFTPKDGHLNDAGHELAALSLLDFILMFGLSESIARPMNSKQQSLVGQVR